MYSPTQQEFSMDPNDHFSHPTGMGTPHTTVGAVPVTRNNRVFNSSTAGSYHIHQRHNSFGNVSIAMSPPQAAAAANAANAAAAGRGISFADPNAQHWFGTSLDSTGSSFGQSPIFGGRDLIMSPSTSTGHIDGFGGDDDEHQQRNLQEIFEKRRRRRESHNAVERRRRDNINERIQEHMLESAPTSSNVISSVNSQTGASGKAINKGTILKMSVDHIKDLREEVSAYKNRIKELEQLIEAARHGNFNQDTQHQTHMNPMNHVYSESNHRPRHERMGSLQFQQQFGNLNIGTAKGNTIV
ncbi:hypothetical protein BDF14DRAFT_1718732 [Spinellus fusiger]|nr:hypothetical protein BDF14DRAFT_1718732 [Spinellus fusiger]